VDYLIVEFGTGGRVTVLDQFYPGNTGETGIEKIEARGVTHGFQVGTDAANSLAGGAGDDLLHGSSGGDTLIGRAGDDLFVFADGDGADTVRDFTAGADTEDKINLAAVSDANSYAGVTANASQDGADTLLDFAQVDIRLLGVQLNALDQADFLFA